MTQRSLTWKQSGTISLWRYTENQRNYPGWHLAADAEGCASLLALLDAFSSDGIAASRTLALSTPTEVILSVPNNRSSSCVSASKFRLTFSTDKSQWAFPDATNPAELIFGSEWIPKLRQAIAGISQGNGDFSIGHTNNGSLPLWFWWSPQPKYSK